MTGKRSMLTCKRISASDAHLLTLLFSFAYSDGFNSSPLPFPCSIKPRSPTHVKIIEEEFREAMTELETYAPISNKIT